MGTIYLFGNFRSGRSGVLPGRHTKRLLIYLLLWPNMPHHREVLAQALWPHLPPERGRRTLSDALYRLRLFFRPTWVVVENETISLRQTADLWVDIWAFAVCIQQGQFAEAAALYVGDLATEIEDDWIWGRREELREQLTAVLLKLGETAEKQQQYETAYTWYIRLANQDNLNEVAQCGLMRCLAAQNRLTDALNIYQMFQQFLAQELSVAPAPSTQQLAHQLQMEWEVQQQTSSHLMKLPFVGRVMERARLLGRLEQARNGQGGIIVILGEAGIGKTRLIESLVQSADWRGWQIGQGRGEEFVLPQPYAPLSEALTAVLPRPRLQQLTHLLPPWSLTLIGHIVPAIHPHLPPVSLPESTHPNQQLMVALRLLLGSLHQIAPHLLILDDVQWADPAIWPMLNFLQPALAEMSVLVVISGRFGGLQEQPTVWELLATWEQAGVMSMQLAGLEPQALADLARAMGQPLLNTAELAVLHQTSGGNPLLAISLLESGSNTAPPELMALQHRRLDQLNDAALLVLQAAAVLGYRFDYQLWETMITAIPNKELPGLAGELEQKHFLVLEKTGYRFRHDTLRAAVYYKMPADRRHFLHRQALAAYTQHHPNDTLNLLYHATEAREETAVIQYALMAGQAALERFAYIAARQYFTQALALLPHPDTANRYTALYGRIRAVSALGDRTAQRSDLVMLYALAEQMGDSPKIAEVLALQAKFFWQTADFPQARHAAQTGLQLATSPVIQATLWEVLGQVERDQGYYALASEHFVRAGGLFDQAGHLSGKTSTCLMLGIVAQRQGDFSQAIALFQQVETMAQAANDHLQRASALGNLVTAYWGLSQYQEAIEYCHRALTLSREIGALWIESATLSNLGSLHAILGDYAAAIEYTKQALTVSRITQNHQELASTSSNLAYFYLDSGQAERALPLFDEALALNRQMGRRRGEGYSLHGRGSAFYHQGRYAEAIVDLELARSVRQELGEINNVCLTEAELTMAFLANGQLKKATQIVATVLGRLSPDISPDTRQYVHFAAYSTYLAQGQETLALQQLCRAEQLLRETAEFLPPHERHRFLTDNAANRMIQTAVLRHRQQIQMKLTRSGVPLGRKLTANDYVVVNWAVYTVSDETVEPGANRRRGVLQRLLAEAAEQNAAPTDNDLAQVLQVSRRTILRDMAVLASGGGTNTRRRTKGEV